MRTQKSILISSIVLLVTAAGATGAAAQWIERRSTDQMTGETRHQAMLTSDNIIELGFPFKPTKGALFFSSGDSGLFASFGVQDGIIECSPVSGCLVQVQADQKPAIMFKAQNSTSQTKSVMFADPSALAAYISGSTSIKVRTMLFQHGIPVFEFRQNQPLPLTQPAPR